MSTPHLSERGLALISALNRRGIRGRQAQVILRRHAQGYIARQVDYYDHEVVFRARLPLWAATPWLSHRIRHDVPAPSDYLESSRSLGQQLRAMPYRTRRNVELSAPRGRKEHRELQ